MLKRKLQDLTVCCSYQINFLHQKAHSAKEFRRQYVVMEEISRGGFGIVYRAVRLSDSLPVAVKFVEHKHVREWTLTCNQLIPSEVCHLDTCRDIPGVIRLIDWFANSKGFLIVMERPENCMDLFDLISTYGKLDEDTARGIFIQVVDSVCAMYVQHGLIHRDIKDENLIVDMKTGEVKIVDFGAAASAEKAMKKEFQGTRSYCPPEWFRKLQYLPLEATSWSLGVLLYILVTGQLPFKNEIQICLGRIKFPSHVSKECRQLIKSCLTTSAGSRAGFNAIRQHSWLSKTIPVHKETFEAVLEMMLGKAQGD
uniref:Serine/threonine-protein kinase 1 n=1 Tax=Angiostrongylus cantonensis TaxID=6313 RepID=A0A0K0DDX0_ANGCA